MSERREIAGGATAAEARARDHVGAMTAEAERQAQQAAIEEADADLESNFAAYVADFALLEVAARKVTEMLDDMERRRGTDFRLARTRVKLDGSDALDHVRLPTIGFAPRASRQPFGPTSLPFSPITGR